jgi:hypothetical protein
MHTASNLCDGWHSESVRPYCRLLMVVCVVTGWPLLRAAFNDLVFFYRKAREAIRVC